MQKPARRLLSAKHAAKVLALICFSIWLFPIYEEGIKALLVRASRTTLTPSNSTMFAVLAFSIWVPISFAWRRSLTFGATVQFGLLAGLVVWLAVFARDVLRTWASYSLLLLAVCFGLWILMFVGGLALAMIDKRSAS